MWGHTVIYRVARAVRARQVRDRIVQQAGAIGGVDPPRAFETWIMTAGIILGMLSLFFYSLIGMAVAGGLFFMGLFIAVVRSIRQG